MSAPVSAKLLDAFALAGRGTVVVLGDIEGAILIGDQGKIGGLAFEVTGLESIRFAKAEDFPPDTIGALVDFADTDALRAVIGQRVAFSAPGPD